MGMRVSGVLPSSDGEPWARTGKALLRRAEMHVEVVGGEGDGWRSASAATGVAVWIAVGVAAGPDWVVVWPFSSVEREKMTWPWWG